MERPDEAMPEKPKFGDPCNGCGFCCAVELCSVAEMIFDDNTLPCPLLSFHDGRSWCKLVETEKIGKMEPLIADTLGIGLGCFVE